MNSDKRVRSIPVDIISSKHDFPKNLVTSVDKVIKDIKPRYMMPILSELNEWFVSVVIEHADNSREYAIKLQQIKEINAKERLRKATKDVSSKIFGELVANILRQSKQPNNTFKRI